ncbi:MAG: aldo/keto reductase [Chloroflexota bacterium]|nr:aldo/keto reductase [Chloroflexota bacterium]
MEYRRLGKTGWDVSPVSVGAWALGNQWGDLSDDTARDTVRAALDCGINLFDVADGYGPLLAEERLGKALGSERSSVFIATKVGNLGNRQGHAQAYTHPLHIVSACHASLHRLGTDYIDLYQCHQADPDNVEVFLEGFGILREQGKIRHFGVSSGNADVIAKFDADGECAIAQIDYSIVRRGAERAALPFCLERDIGTLIRGSLGQGVLTGKYDAETRFGDSVRSGWNDGERRELFLKELAVAAAVGELSRPGRGLVELALGFVLAHPAVTCAITGAKSPGQIRANAAAGAVSLTSEELETIRECSADMT